MDSESNSHFIGAEWATGPTFNRLFEGMLYSIKVYANAREQGDVESDQDVGGCPAGYSTNYPVGKCLIECDESEYLGVGCSPCNNACTNGCIDDTT